MALAAEIGRILLRGRTISAKQLKDLGLLSGSDCCEISWRNCFGESLGKVHIELLEGGNGNRTRFLILRHGVLLPGDEEKAETRTLVKTLNDVANEQGRNLIRFNI